MKIIFDEKLKGGYKDLFALARLKGYSEYEQGEFFNDYHVYANTRISANDDTLELFFNAIRKEKGYIVPNQY